MKNIGEGEDHRNAPGTSFECFRLVQKLEGKFEKFSYILTAIISDVILNPKACNLQNTFTTIRSSFLAGCYVFCLILMIATEENSWRQNGVYFWYQLERNLT